MKKFFNILAAVAATVAMTACTTDLDDARIDPSNVVAPALTVPATIDLGSADATIEFDMTPIDYGFAAAVQYTLYMQAEGAENPVSLAATIADGKVQVERFALNNALVGSGLPTAQPAKMNMWLTAGMLNDKGALLESTLYNSETMTTSITTYVWSVKGLLLKEGENPVEAMVDMKEKAADSWILEKAKVYGAFKFVKNHNDAESLGGSIAKMKEDFAVSAGGADIDITGIEDYDADGIYNITLNTATGKAQVYIPDAKWGLIGAFNGWGADVDMIEQADGIWVSPVTKMSGEFKIRYAGDWADNRGGAYTSNGELFAVTPGGDNIMLPEEAEYQVVYYQKIDKMSITKVDSANTWGLIGAAVMGGEGWNYDFRMANVDGKWVANNVYIDGQFKARLNGDWTTNFGLKKGTKLGDLGTASEVEQDGDNIDLYKNFYNVVLDTANATITISKGESYADAEREYAEEVLIRGDFGDADWSETTALKFAMGKYSGGASGYAVFHKMENGFKFFYNDGAERWFGVSGTPATDGTPTNLGGDNFILADGAYHFVLNVAEGTVKFLALTPGIIGSATPGKWDNETPMLFDATTGLYSLTADLTEGAIKIRFNGNWDYNLGGALDNMVYNGSDILVAEAGTYDIVLDMTAQPMKMTMTKK